MLAPEIIAARETTLAAHLLGESTKDVGAVLATFTGVPCYDLVSVGKTVLHAVGDEGGRGRGEVPADLLRLDGPERAHR
jgi:hypothetical protein